MNASPDNNVPRRTDGRGASRWKGPLTADQFDRCFHRYMRHHAVALGVDEAERKVRRATPTEFYEIVFAVNRDLATQFPGYADVFRGFWACVRDHASAVTEALCRHANEASDEFKAAVPDFATLANLYLAFMHAYAGVAALTGWTVTPDPEDNLFNRWQAHALLAFRKVNGDVLVEHLKRIERLRKQRAKTPPDVVKTVERLRHAEESLRVGREPKYQPTATLRTPPDDGDVRRERERPQPIEVEVPEHFEAENGDVLLLRERAEEQHLRSLLALEQLGNLEALGEREREIVEASLGLGLEPGDWWSREHHRRLADVGVTISHVGLHKMGKRIVAKLSAG